MQVDSTPKSAPNLTSSRTGTFYFAYGSNLSPEQMAGRCLDSPVSSSTPAAIARLDGWRWIICQRGYANIVPVPSLPVPAGESSRGKSLGRSESGFGEGGKGQRPPSNALQADAEEDDDDDVVWGIIYNLTPTSESILDEYEGHDGFRNPTPTPNPSPDPEEVRRKPFLQGEWDYNKLYLPVRVTKWLRPRELDGFTPASPVAESGLEVRECEGENEITALIYVDEIRMASGAVRPEYVGRMNRAIRQGVELGLPGEWVERVMRRWIVEGVEVEARAYLGRRDGYWDDEGVGQGEFERGSGRMLN